MKKILQQRFVYLILISSFIGCKKDFFKQKGQGENDVNQAAVERFLTLPANAGKELNEIVNDLKRMENRSHFLTRFISRNGFPKWEFTVSSKSLFNTSFETLQENKNQSNNSTDSISSAPIYFIPLIDTNSREIISFIFCAKTGDSLYRYQVYNKNDLIKNIPKNISQFNNGTLLMGVFATFENSINHKKKVSFGYPYTHEFLDPKINFNTKLPTTAKLAANSKNQTQGLKFDQPSAIKFTSGCWIPRFAVIDFVGASIGIHWLHNICTGENKFQFFYSPVMTPNGDADSGGGTIPGSSSGSTYGGIFIGGAFQNRYGGYDPNTGNPIIYNGGSGGGQIYPGGDPIPPGTNEDPAWGVVQVPQIENPYAAFQVFSSKELNEEEIILDDDTDTTGTDYLDYGTYQDSQTWPTVTPIFTMSEYIGWGYPNLPENCFDYAKNQLKLKGFYPAPRNTPGQYWQVLDSVGTVHKTVAKQGISYINAALQNSTPVLIGVQLHSGLHTKNADKATDHFIVIVGSGTEQDGRKFYLFFDNAANYKLPNEGAHAQNKLYWNESNGTIEGDTNATYADLSKPHYKVTQIRKTRKP